MGMSIDEAQAALGKERKYALHENKQAFDIAIETMRKYQKIEEIYQWAKDRSYLVEADDIMDKLKEAVENGN